MKTVTASLCVILVLVVGCSSPAGRDDQAVALAVSGARLGAQSILLVSGPQHYDWGSSGTDGVRLFLVLVEHAPPSQLRELMRIDPEGGVNLISHFPEQDLLVIWGTSKDVTDPSARGYVKVVPLARPEKYTRLELPCRPFRGGYLLSGPENGSLQVATLGTDKNIGNTPVRDFFIGKTFLHTLVSGESRTVRDQEVQWDHVVKYGTNQQRDYDIPLLAHLDPKTGGVVYEIGRQECRSSVQVPPDLFNPGTINLSWAGVAVCSTRFRVLTVGSKPEEHNSRYWSIHDRSKGTWQKLRLFGFRTRTQLLGDWLVLSEGIRERPGPKAETLVSGKHTFHNCVTQHSFETELAPTAEVLCVIGDQLFYRVGDELYRATLAETGLKNKRSVLRSPVLETVHWASSYERVQTEDGGVQITLPSVDEDALVTGLDALALIEAASGGSLTGRWSCATWRGVRYDLLEEGKRVGSFRIAVWEDADAALAELHRDADMGSIGARVLQTLGIGDKCAPRLPRRVTFVRKNVLVDIGLHQEQRLKELCQAVDMAIQQGRHGVKHGSTVRMPRIERIDLPERVKAGEEVAVVVTVALPEPVAYGRARVLHQRVKAGEETEVVITVALPEPFAYGSSRIVHAEGGGPEGRMSPPSRDSEALLQRTFVYRAPGKLSSAITDRFTVCHMTPDCRIATKEIEIVVVPGTADEESASDSDDADEVVITVN